MNETVSPREDRDDSDARARALDVDHSWLVQAPAGSGKTGLLIQRYLALLARVERPERIVAMTFTRKAAAEMRERVLAAMTAAARGDPVEASPHHATTRRLAEAALDRDGELGWNLRQHPARLRIMTIDALAASIARQAPVSAGLGALPEFVEDATPLYRAAARELLSKAPAADRHWRVLLRWLDNNAELVVDLLARMLAARDRWAPLLLPLEVATARRSFEGQLAHEIRFALAALRDRFPPPLVERLARIAATAAQGFEEESSRAAFMRALVQRGELPDAQPDARADWEELAGWVLTRSGAFCRQVRNEQHGLAPVGSGPGKSERARRKAEFAAWLADAGAVPGLADALHAIRALPPDRLGDEAWELVASALELLPQAAASLLTVFAAQGRSDFAEATLRALHALGRDEDPSDLLLALDYRVEHLLVDEFQDTSAAQLQLIERLTSGWEQGDGRTLFAVGDPMQSIYRFRQADVRIFVEAQQRKHVGRHPVGVLELSRNFRSQPAVIDWVNDVFARVLGSRSDATSGAVAYRTSRHGGTASREIIPTLTLVEDRAAEADEIVRRVEQARSAGCRDIAVLLRARAHATLLLPALRDAGVAYAAVELEALHERPATRDLLSLVRALTQPADRLAWLSILRAPWCGMALADLLVLVERAGNLSLPTALHDDQLLRALSDEGRMQAVRLRDALAPVSGARGRMALSRRVRAAWLALGGPACAESDLDRRGADLLFELLDEHESAGDLRDFAAFESAARGLYAPGAERRPDVVQVMTLHKAKGLEFDAVILPGLDRRPNRGEEQLLRWKVRDHGSAKALLLAPMRARAGVRSEPEPVYRYLASLDEREDREELGRLLYVGTTRARRHLHLIAVARVQSATNGERNWQRPTRGSALERLWDALELRRPPVPEAETAQPSPESPEKLAADPIESPAPRADPLARLAADWTFPSLPQPIPYKVVAQRDDTSIVFDWADATAAAIGTVTHRFLAQIAAEGLPAWPAERIRGLRDAIGHALAIEGLDASERRDAVERVAAALTRTLQDPRGRWLFDPAHEDARSEWALSGNDAGAVVHVVVDRSFVCDGTRWIIDYKTGRHEGGDVAAFLDREVTRYRDQLERYARIVAALDPRPARLALYYPLVDGGWREFDAAS